ncbi:MAG: hypothetical protein ACYS0I_20280 [Planctomycetota bacterium]|jgi:hypothetical protein
MKKLRKEREKIYKELEILKPELFPEVAFIIKQKQNHKKSGSIYNSAIQY